MIADILFAISFTVIACTVCWVGVVCRSTRRTIRCRCGRTVRRVSLINSPDIARYSLLLTDECPGCHCSSGSQPAIHPSSFRLPPSSSGIPHADL